MTDCNVRLFFWGRGGGAYNSSEAPSKGVFDVEAENKFGFEKAFILSYLKNDIFNLAGGTWYYSQHVHHHHVMD